MKALDFLKEKGLIKEGNSQFIIKFADGPSFELVGLMEEFLKRNTELAKISPKYQIGERVYIIGDPSGKRYTIKDFNPNNGAYYIQNAFGETTWCINLTNEAP